MQIFILGLIFVIYWHDLQGQAWPLVHVPAGWLAGLGVLGFAVIGGAYHLLVRWTLARLNRRTPPRHALTWLDRGTAVARAATFLWYVACLAGGLLQLIRTVLGDWVLLDEIIILALPVGTVIWGYAAYYPIDRRMREARLIHNLDLGLPVSPIWTRGQFVLSQVRHQIGLILLPVLLLVGWSEAVVMYLPDRIGDVAIAPWQPAIQLAGVAAIFVCVPWLLRLIWDTVPLSPGPLLTQMQWMCKTHRVGVRHILLWRTFGGMVNAAVIGIIKPVRYILLSDALLEQMTNRQVEAVMAHELAHIRKHHMPWMLVVLFAMTSGVTTLMVLLAQGTNTILEQTGMAASVGLIDQSQLDTALIVVVPAAFLLGFGWVSRRFERQADTFAVQHLCRHAWVEPAGQTDHVVVEQPHPQVVDHAAAATMCQALDRVAGLNHMPVDKRSWRHGSIRWRQDYLMSLVGQPIDQLAIHRCVGWIKLIAAGLVLLGLVVYKLMPAEQNEPDAPSYTSHPTAQTMEPAPCSSPKCTASATITSTSTALKSPSTTRPPWPSRFPTATSASAATA